MPKRLTSTMIVLISIALLSSLTLALALTNQKVLAQGAGSDETNDLIRGCTGESVNQETLEMGGFIDIVAASASIEDSSLILRLQTEEPIPSRADSLVSYSFVLDLDGDKSTGFVGERKPIGVFHQLGIDLWVNYSLYREEKGDFGFLGSPNIPNMSTTPALINLGIKEDRHLLKVTVPVNLVERKLKYAYMQLNPPWEVKPKEMNWVAFTSWAPLSRQDPVIDIYPETHYSENRKSCFANPLVKIAKQEEKEKGRGEEKEPPPPPAPPTPPQD